MTDYIVTAPDRSQHNVTAPAGADDASILGFVHNMISNSGTAIRDQWDKGEPFRVAIGALMNGDTATAKKVIEDRFANTTQQDIINSAVNIGSGMAPLGIVGATAWHGSPHLFDKFKSEAIGTGEGAQAYGHGLYLAEAPAVAKEYMKVDPSVVLPPNRLFQGQALQAGTPQYHAATLVDSMGLPTAKKNVAQWIADAQGKPEMAREMAGWQQTLDTLNSATKKSDFKTAPNVPNLYKTDIPDAHIDKMLDWDKPLSEQHPDVQAALQQYGINADPRIDEYLKLRAQKYPSGMTKVPLSATDESRMQELLPIYQEGGLSGANGQQIYKMLTDKFGSQQSASDALAKQGLTGIKYLDGTSRTAGEGTRNFVIFNPDDIRILERNGVATGATPWDIK